MTLSHYRIVSKIGAGGMRLVYLAEDTRLDRKVALKLLPATFTQDAERVRGFMQGRTLSAIIAGGNSTAAGAVDAGGASEKFESSGLRKKDERELSR